MLDGNRILWDNAHVGEAISKNSMLPHQSATLCGGFFMSAPKVESIDEYRLSVLMQQARAMGQHESHIEWGMTVFDLDGDEDLDELEVIEQTH